MRIFRKARLALVVAVVTLSAGCFGKFALVRNLYIWNSNIGNKWARTAVYWGLSIIPVYELAAVADALVLNAIEFWSGENPVPVRGTEGATATKVIEVDGREATITYHDGGRRIVIERGDERFELRGDEMGSTLTDGHGRLLFETRVTEDGGAEVRDGAGVVVLRRSAAQVDALADVLRKAPAAYVDQAHVQQGARLAKAR